MLCSGCAFRVPNSNLVQQARLAADFLDAIGASSALSFRTLRLDSTNLVRLDSTNMRCVRPAVCEDTAFGGVSEHLMGVC